MKIDKEACLHLFTTATTAMAAVLPQQYHDDVTTQPNPKPLKYNYLFNDNAASSAVVGHPTTAKSMSTANTSTENPILDTSVRKSDQVLANKKEKPFLDTSTKQQDTTDADADVGILEYGAVFPSFKTMSEVQQRHRRLEDFVCPDGNCPFMANDPFSLNSGDTFTCTATYACQNFVVENFASGSTITCNAFGACQYMDATGAGTISCSGSFSCFDAEVTLQNEGRLECDFAYACETAIVTFTGSSFVECRTFRSCGINNNNFVYPSTFIANSDGSTLLCKERLSCYANFDLRGYDFLLICEDSYSCASGSYVVGTENTCVVCAQENGCTQLDNTFFEDGANKTQPQLSGQCSDMQIDTACTLINSTLASSLTFCQTSPPSASLLPSMTPSESFQPSLVPSIKPSESSHPSLVPSMPPSSSSHPSNLPTGKPLVGKPTIGKKAGSGKKEAGSKKGSYGGKKKHPETWSGKKEITKVEDIEMREP